MSRPRWRRSVGWVTALAGLALAAAACSIPDTITTTEVDHLTLAPGEIRTVDVVGDDTSTGALTFQSVTSDDPDGLKAQEADGGVEVQAVIPDRRFRVRYRATTADGRKLRGLLVVDVTEPAEPGRLTVTPQPLDFGEVQVDAEKELTLEITNEGEIELTLRPGRPDQPFTADEDPDRCRRVEPGGSCSLTVRYRPPSPDRHTATWTLAAAGFDPVDVQLSGQGIIADFTIEPTGHEGRFGPVAVGGPQSTLTYTLVNRGTVALDPRPEGWPDAIGGTFDGCRGVQPDEDCSFSVTLGTDEPIDLDRERLRVVADRAEARTFPVSGRVAPASDPAFDVVPRPVGLAGIDATEAWIVNTGQVTIERFEIEPADDRIAVDPGGCGQLESQARCQLTVALTEEAGDLRSFSTGFTVRAGGRSLDVPVLVSPEARPPADLVVVACRRRSETVVIANQGTTVASLEGWVLLDDQDNRFRLGPVELGPGETIEILSGPDAEPRPGALVWTTTEVWDDGGDIAYLQAPDGRTTPGCVCTDD